MAGFTPEQQAELLDLMALVLDKRFGSGSVATPPTASPESVAVVLGESAKSSKSTKVDFTAEQVTAQRAADIADPQKTGYTVVARNRIIGQYDYAAYVAVWTPIRDRMVAAGMPKKAANKQAQVEYDFNLKAEVVRLRERDGLATGKAPVVNPDSIRSQGTHSDPTANQAIANVSREERLAALQQEMDLLKLGLVTVTSPPEAVKVPSAASVAQKAIAANPRQRTIDKIVRDARASGKPAVFVQDWLRGRCQAKPNFADNYRTLAKSACDLLGLRTA